MADKQRSTRRKQPKDTKSIPVAWSTCNCTSFWLPKGILRTLLIHHYPHLKGLSTEPCPHKQYGVIDLAKNSPKANKRSLKSAQTKPNDPVGNLEGRDEDNH